MVTLEVVGENLRVAIVAGSARQKLNLKSILENNQLQVVADDDLLDYLAGSFDSKDIIADVLLVDLDENDESDSDTLDVLIEKTDLPILFNDSAATRNQHSAGGSAWGKRLAKKLKDLVADQNSGRIIEQAKALADKVSSNDSPSDDLLVDELPCNVATAKVSNENVVKGDDIDLGKYERKLAENRQKSQAITQATGAAISRARESREKANQNHSTGQVKALNNINVESVTNPPLSANCAKQIWILGASHGGPQAIKEFLSELPAGLPVGFVLVQHIGSGVVSALVEQLNRISKLNVDKPRSGRMLKNGELLVSPVDKRVSFDQHGHIILKPIVKKTTFNPSIDLVFQEVAKFGTRAGGIVFSGMGNDGMLGVKTLREAGGTIWAQDADSCVISSMADCARKTGMVQFSASPTVLAQRLVTHLRKVS
ncbi:Chemotaxis response regulator protein-glutamate methylesterase CheB [hydrothermal vent metagenome]|uniref:protein-glutamate methylesterase n=1 Tax=hydrothermal vent metagenome TaxID=652676 RepID=A0A3B0YZD8_9ZZZZ